ncbi:hypothetical protein O1611_g5116 [Lasiodiplodia mahajangana]|uniref:Uncharacterized protein n=1 Tax=Lasiodiplodia mahajangana TaxID=1108764 RepID=A0ACC2JM18_9PEZI|nr:hypothetical protein O1611_g5116 [Lasiodiplodia mahajangana]
MHVVVGEDEEKPVYPLPIHNSSHKIEVDIIVVYGPGSDGDWPSTWEHDNKFVDWLRESSMLPATVPNSKIAVFNNGSKWDKDAPGVSVELCAEELIRSVKFLPTVCGRPIIFVGNGLGGNVIVDALLLAGREDEYKSVLDQVAGLLFLGTPFRGIKLPRFLDRDPSSAQLAGAYDGITSDLFDKFHPFRQLCNKLSVPVSCFYKQYNDDPWLSLGIPGTSNKLVAEDASACIPGFEAYKFPVTPRQSFLEVSKVINTMYTNAKAVVGRRQKPRPVITNWDYALIHNPKAETYLWDLFPTEPSEDKNTIKLRKGNHACSTSEWIFGTEEMTKWLCSRRPIPLAEPSSNLLWLHGNPGIGKSTIALSLTEELSKYFASNDGKTLAYFFCDSDRETRRTATSVIRGILLQLVQQQPQLLDYIIPKWVKRGAQPFASFENLWAILMAIGADQLSGQAYCIIDALDECDEESQDILLLHLREAFSDEYIVPKLRILIISRPSQKIRQKLGIFMNMDVASFPARQKDVDLCIEESVNDLAKQNNYTDRVKQQVLESIRTKAESNFLWVGLARAVLMDVSSADAVKTLQNIPKELHSLYLKLFNAATSRKSANADSIRRILGVVTVCREPLTLLQLSEACGLHHEQDDEKIQLQSMRNEVSSCGLMTITLDHHVLLLHHSVRDFLTQSSGNYVDVRRTHATLAYRCIDVIMEEFRTQRPNHLSSYAINYWADHARMAGIKFTMMRPSLDEFFAITSPCREWWLKRKDPAGDEKISVRRVAAKWGISSLIDDLAYFDEQPQEPGTPVRSDVPDGSNVTLVAEATLSGHLDVIQNIWDAGWEEPAQLLVPAAANEKHGKDIVELLLGRLGDEITINWQTYYTVADGNRQHDKEVLKRLLDRIQIAEKILSAAAQNPQPSEELVDVLLGRLGPQVPITGAMIIANTARYGEKSAATMARLFHRLGGRITLYEVIIPAAARN